MKTTKFLTGYELTKAGKALMEKGSPLRLPGNLTSQGAIIDAPIQIKNLEHLTDDNAKRLFDRKDGLGKKYVKEVQQRSASAANPPTTASPKTKS